LAKPSATDFGEEAIQSAANAWTDDELSLRDRSLIGDRSAHRPRRPGGPAAHAHAVGAGSRLRTCGARSARDAARHLHRIRASFARPHDHARRTRKPRRELTATPADIADTAGGSTRSSPAPRARKTSSSRPLRAMRETLVRPPPSARGPRRVRRAPARAGPGARRLLPPARTASSRPWGTQRLAPSRRYFRARASTSMGGSFAGLRARLSTAIRRAVTMAAAVMRACSSLTGRRARR